MLVNSEPTDGVIEVSRTKQCTSATIQTEISLKLAVPDPRNPEMEELLEELPETEELLADVEALDLPRETNKTGGRTAETEREDWRTSLKAGQVPVQGSPFNKLKIASLSE